MLDRFWSIRLIVSQNFDTFTEEQFISNLQVHRKEAVSYVMMLFWIAAEGIRSKAPLPRYFVNAVGARNRFYYYVKDLPEVKKGMREMSGHHTTDLVRFYAYLLGE